MPLINRVGGGSAELQSKTVKATTSEQTVTPDSDFDGLSSVKVEALRLQTKWVSNFSEDKEWTPDEGYDGLAKVTTKGWGKTYTSDLREFTSASNGEITGIVFPGVTHEPQYVIMIIGDRMLPLDMRNDYSGDECISSIIYDKSKAIPYFMASDMGESNCGSVGRTIFHDGARHSSHFSTFRDDVSSIKFEYDSENQKLTFTKNSGDPYLLPGQMFVIVVY